MRPSFSFFWFLPSAAILTACAGANAGTSPKAVSAAAATAPATTTAATETAVIYSNTEEVYFDPEAGKEAAPKLTISVSGGKVTYLDDFGAPTSAPAGVAVVKIEDDVATLNTGKRTTELRRGNPTTCWASVRKDKPKADGKEDWHFVPALKSHDQGGRIRVGGGASGAPEAVFRMRTVYWPKPSTSRPSKVLYVHTADDPDRAVSYSWANIEASRVGVNLRWIQVSCTIDGAESGSQITAGTFRG